MGIVIFGAMGLYRMYTKHSDAMISYDVAHSTLLAEANADILAAGLVGVTASGLEQSLTPAATQLINTYAPGQNFSPLNIWVGDSAGGALMGSGTTADLMIGDVGSDTLQGRGGDDVLIGGAGNDTLIGGTGSDTMIGGVGYDTYLADNGDTIYDEDGSGQIYATSANLLLAGGTRKSGDDYFVGDVGGLKAVYGEAADGTIDVWVDGTSHFTIRPSANRAAPTTSANGDVVSGMAGLGVSLTTLAKDPNDPGNPGGPAAPNDPNDPANPRNKGARLKDPSGQKHWKKPPRGIHDPIGPAGSLALQTRLKPMLDLIGLKVDANGISPEFTNLNAAIQSGMATNPAQWLGDWLDFNRSTDAILTGTDWNGWSQFETSLRTLPVTPELQAVYSSLNVSFQGAGVLSGGALADVLVGDAQNNTINGNNGDDVLFGGAGNDTLSGGIGTNALIGGTGDDTYVVDSASDLVHENANEGTDTVQSSVSYTFGANVENLVLLGSGAINGTGNELNNVITGNSGANTIYGGAGDDTITDTGGNNSIYGGDGNDTVTINYVGANLLEGGAGNDTLTVTHNSANGYDAGYYNESTTFVGGAGNDRMVGSSGADTYVFNRGDGSDTILDIGTNAYGWGYTKSDAVQFGAGISASDISASRSGNNLLLKIADPANPLAGDQVSVENWFTSDAYRIETFTFADGTSLTKTQLSQMVGTAGDDNLIGTAYGDTLIGLDGNDVLNGNAGNDILQGGNGNDSLDDTAGANLLNGGAGTDTLTGNAGNEMFVGGTGNDTITTGGGADIIAFNRGDGMDVVNGGIGTDNTVTLGKGISYADIALSKVNNDLILEVGAGEQITLANWYDTTANYKSVLDLQVMADAMATFDPTSPDPLLNQTVQNFDFTAIAANFDQARGTSATFMHWSATNSLLTAHLASSDITAIGGDLAHQYGTNGSFTGLNLTAAQDVLNAPQFGSQAQTLRPLQGLQGGAVTL